MAKQRAQPTSSNGSGTDTAMPLRQLAAQSALLRRYALASELGYTFEGARDVYTALGYKRTLTYADYESRYERDGLARAVVDMLPTDTWGGGLLISESDETESDTPQWDTDIESWATHLDLLHRLLSADILARLYHYSVILIGAPGDLATPMPRLRTLDDIQYLRPLGAPRARIATEELTDTASPRFGLPLTYECHLGTGATGLLGPDRTGSSIVKHVHWTRILHVVERPLEDETHSTPVLKPNMNRFEDLEKIVGSAGEGRWRQATNAVHINVTDPQINLTPAQADELKAEAEELTHGLRHALLTRAADIKSLNQSPRNPINDDVTAIVELIAGTYGYPVRRLLGSERGELASSQDADMYRTLVSNRRQQKAIPLVRKLLGHLKLYGVAVPDDYVVEIHDTLSEDPTKRSTRILNLARANKEQRAATGHPVLTSNELRGEAGYEPLDEFDAPPPSTPQGGAAQRGGDETAATPDDADDIATAADEKVNDDAEA